MTAIICVLSGRALDPGPSAFALRLDDATMRDIPTLGVPMRHGDKVKVTLAAEVAVSEPRLGILGVHVNGARSGLGGPSALVEAVGAPRWWEHRHRRIASRVAEEVLASVDGGSPPGAVLDDFSVVWSVQPLRTNRLADARMKMLTWWTPKGGPTVAMDDTEDAWENGVLATLSPTSEDVVPRTMEVVDRLYSQAKKSPGESQYAGRNLVALVIEYIVTAPEYAGNRTLSAAREVLMQEDFLEFLKRQVETACLGVMSSGAKSFMSSVAKSLLEESSIRFQRLRREAMEVLSIPADRPAKK